MRSNRLGNEVVITRWKRNQNEAVYYPPLKPYSPPSRTSTIPSHHPASTASTSPAEIKISQYYNKQNVVKPPTTVRESDDITSITSSEKDIKGVIAPRFYAPKPQDQFWKSYPSPQSSLNCRRWCSTFTVVVAVLIAIILLLVVIMVLIFGLRVFITSTEDDVDNTTDDDVLARETSFMSFYNFRLNATDAEEYCQRQKGHLLIIRNEYDEQRLFERIRNNSTLMRECKNAYLGYRSLQDKDWVSQDSQYGFQAMYTDIWSNLAYDSPIENCSHSSKVLHYKLNPTTCNFINECAMCQVNAGSYFCKQRSVVKGDTCFVLDEYRTSSYNEGIKLCKDRYDGILAPVPNKQVFKKFLATIKEEINSKKKCSTIAIGMVLNRRIGNMYSAYKNNDWEVKYIPKSFNPALGSIKDNCLVISLHDRWDTIKFADCSQQNCFICMKNS